MKEQALTRARLQREFSADNEKDTGIDEKYAQFNALIENDPEGTAMALDALVEGRELPKGYENLAELVEHILNLTNNGAAIGLNTDAAWGDVFSDTAHHDAIDDLHLAETTGDIVKIEEKRRSLGRTTLRAVARTHLHTALPIAA